MVRTKVVDGKVVDGFTVVGKSVREHLHKFIAHTGVRGNEVADAFAKHVCRSPEDPQVRIAPSKVVVERDLSFICSTGFGFLNGFSIKYVLFPQCFPRVL